MSEPKNTFPCSHTNMVGLGDLIEDYVTSRYEGNMVNRVIAKSRLNRALRGCQDCLEREVELELTALESEVGS